MQILHLVISAKNSYYDSMFQSLAALYGKQQSVRTYFVEFHSKANEETTITDNKIILRGTESYVPGILRKTIDALLLLESELDKYDILVRSNLSTAINFNYLFEYIESVSSPVGQSMYFGANLLRLRGINPPFGIHDSKWEDTIYAEGTLIGMTPDIVKHILLHRHYLPTTLIDDVAIGVYMREQYPGVQCLLIPQERTHGWIEPPLADYQQIINVHQYHRPIAWRNKTSDRNKDALRLAMITRIISGEEPDLNNDIKSQSPALKEICDIDKDDDHSKNAAIGTDAKMNQRKTLDLGSGSKPKNPFGAELVYGVDIRDDPDANIRYADLATSSIPFESNYFDYCTAFDFIEHIPRIIYNPNRRYPFVELMNEVYRVLRDEGIFLSFTPAYPAAPAFQDPTHVNIITEETFKYFDVRFMWAKMYGFNGKFFILKQDWKSPYLITYLRKVK